MKANKAQLLRRVNRKLKSANLTGNERVEIIRSIKTRLANDKPAAAKGSTVSFDYKIIGDKLTKEIDRLLERGLSVSNLKDIKIDFPTKLEVTMKKPEWYREPKQKITVEAGDQAPMMSFITEVVSTFVTFLTKLSQRTFTVTKANEDYLKPQTVVLYDPHSRKAVDLKDLFTVRGVASYGGMGSSSVILKDTGGVAIDPATEGTLQAVLAALGGTTTTTLGVGNKDVPTAGTAVPLAVVPTPCKRLHVRTKATNTDFIFIGDSSISATTGLFLQTMDSVTLEVSDLANVYIDANISGEGIVFTYEK